ncbi:hypothetical protein N8Y89_01280, partial [Pelagibacteraceae bacterium]|nr:hypothetical protein [Pelagibacteraceae bacterium]
MNHSEKGFTMVLSLVLLLAMSLMGGALILISSNDHQGNNASDKYQQTFYVAEMALLEGERYLLNEKTGPWSTSTKARDLTKKNLPEKHASKFTGSNIIEDEDVPLNDPFAGNEGSNNTNVDLATGEERDEMSLYNFKLSGIISGKENSYISLANSSGE